jgi:hypothetical protein
MHWGALCILQAIKEGRSTICMNTPGRLPAGMYLLKVIAKDKTIIEKVAVLGN